MRTKLRSLLRATASKLGRHALREYLKEAQSGQYLSKAIHENSNITGKLISIGEPARDFIVSLESPPGESLSDASNVPPEELWEGYAEGPTDYLEYGKLDTFKMLEILKKAGESAETLTTVLDLGCAAGRMLRHYPHYEGKSELWGCDINAKHINWCQQHLSPPFLFATTTTAPHLPFEDNHFDLLYCGSVFTHISDLGDAWFLEIRRVLRKGGYAFLTIHDKHSVDLLLNKYAHTERFHNIVELVRRYDEKTKVTAQNYAYFSIGADPVSQVFYDIDYLLRKWSQYAKVISVNPETYNYQTAILLQK